MSRLTEAVDESMPVVYWKRKDEKREEEEKIRGPEKLTVARDGLAGMRNVGTG